MKEPLTNVKRYRSRNSEKKSKFLLALIVVSALLLVLSGYTVFRSTYMLGDDERDGDTLNIDRAIEKLLDPQHFKEAYIDANGGMDYLQSLQTLRLSGRMQVGDQEFDFFILKRRPGQMLLTYTIGREETTFVVDRGDYKIRRSVDGMNDVVTDMPQKDVDLVKRTVPMFGPILTVYLSEGGQILSLEEAVFNFQPVIALSVLLKGEAQPIKVYVDPAEMTILAQETTTPEGLDEITRFTEYQSVGKINVPHLVSVMANDELQSRSELSSVDFNVGASSVLFMLEN